MRISFKIPDFDAFVAHMVNNLEKEIADYKRIVAKDLPFARHYRTFVFRAWKMCDIFETHMSYVNKRRLDSIRKDVAEICIRNRRREYKIKHYIDLDIGGASKTSKPKHIQAILSPSNFRLVRGYIEFYRGEAQ